MINEFINFIFPRLVKKLLVLIQVNDDDGLKKLAAMEVEKSVKFEIYIFLTPHCSDFFLANSTPPK